MAATDHRVGTVLLTALELEYQAAREYLTDLRTWEHPAGTMFEVGTIRGTAVRVALAVAGEGNQASAVITERANTAFAPDMVILVGIAGGLHPDVALGDVVVATRVYGYHGGKDDPAGFRARPRAWDAPHHLEQHARHLTRTAWWAHLLPGYPDDSFKIHFRPVVAGEVVLDSPASPLAELVRLHYNDAAAIEMESAGAALAARLNRSLPLLTLRGISDRADGQKGANESAGWPSVAAARAAAFALTLIASIEAGKPAVIDAAAGSSTGRTAGRTAGNLTAWQRHAFVDHDRLIGVDQLIRDVCEALVSASGHGVVSLFGEGGIGKTAAAHDAVAGAVAAGAFHRVAWTSAAGAGGALELVPPGGETVHWLDILKDLADQLGFDLGMSRALWAERFGERMASLPPGERALIVIDNLETIEDVSSAIRGLRVLGVDRPHKLLTTTRWQLQPAMAAVTEYRLMPLDDASAVALIRHLGARDRHLRFADDTALRPILDVTGGNPFLIKLATRQYLSSHLPLDLLLNEFRDLGGDGGGGSLARRLRSHLYLRSLRELERLFGASTVTALMSSFCVKGRGDTFTYEDLAAVSGLDDRETFSSVLTGACQLSLITAFGDHGLDRAYTIHSLLHEFTCGHFHAEEGAEEP